MIICPICHGNGFIRREPEEIDTVSDKEGRVSLISLKDIEGCNNCMNSGEISD